MSSNEPGQPDLTEAAFSTNLEPPTSALAIGAHPDDVEFGCGGTLAKWAAAGCVVHHLILTDGSKGTWDINADLPSLVATRRDEQINAAQQLSGKQSGSVTFLDQVDGELGSGLELRSAVARVIREIRPQVVLGHDPWKRYRLHPDHRHAGLLACEAIVAARDPHFFREHGLPAHRPEVLLLFEADQPDHVEDVSPWVDHKLRALQEHKSQFESTMKAVDAAQLEAFGVRIRSRLARLGAPYNLAAAELYKRIIDL